METVLTKRFPGHSATAASRAARAAESVLRALAATGIAIGCAATIAALRYAREELYARAPQLRREVPVYLPDIRYLRLISLRYDNALADALWFRAISYFGEHYRTDRLYPWLAQICELVTDLDPRAEHVYRFAGVILPWEAGQPDAGIALLEKGLRALPSSWRLHFYAGFNWFFFKNDLERAIPHLHRASELPGAHPLVSRLAALLYAAQYGRDAARVFLEELRANAESAEVRAIVGQRLKELQVTEDIEMLSDAIARYRERFGANPASLGELVRRGILAEIPPEPFGGQYLYDPGTGKVESSLGHRPLRLHTSPVREEALRRQGNAE